MLALWITAGILACIFIGYVVGLNRGFHLGSTLTKAAMVEEIRQHHINSLKPREDRDDS